MKRKLLLVVSIITLASSSLTVDSEFTGVGEKWQILTKQNFSSQIRLHPYILLIVTVPWCGESRSLMKQLADHMVTDMQEEEELKLRVIYRNSEKILADAIGAADGFFSVLFYHHSVSYKYRGKFGAVNILHSIYPYMSVLPGELPLKTLNSAADLKAFLESTDKAFVLFDFCGWTPKLLARANNNATAKENHFGLLFSGETDGTQISRENGNEKVDWWFLNGIENGNLKCDIGNVFGGIPWLGEFSTVNDSDPFQETPNMISGVGLSCNFKEFQRFESFFSKFMTAAREFFLPPERHRFGLVSERSLLQYFGIEDSDSGLAILYLAGCPSCSKILKEEDDLKGVLQMKNEFVGELGGDENGHDNVLSANKPSIVLFVDRASGSSETRGKGKEALDTFRELALHYLIPYSSSQKNYQPGIPSVQSNQALRKTSEHPRLKPSPTTQKINLKDKMSIMVINEGQHVVLDNIATDLQGSSLNEILAYLLQKKKDTKLSQLAKEVGFNLLSDDIDIKIVDASPSQKVHSDSVSQVPPEEGLVKNIIDPDIDQSDGASISIEGAKSTFVLPSHRDEEKAFSVDSNEQLLSEVPERLQDPYLTNAKNVKVEEKSSSQVYKLEEPQHQFQGFRGSFYFCDGNYRLLRALTGGSTIPSLVIVDPISQQHYVFPKETIFIYSSMAGFLHRFLNGSLLPYQSSETILKSSREATHPPFVNMDFHEVDSIPRVTTHTFSELVLGLNQSDNENSSNAWNEDVLVLFSSGWCGFCQRMELVVREVYKAIKDYMKMLKNEYTNAETNFHGDNLKNVVSRFPRIYMMDCTLNDCSVILKSMIQRELYPALILFPAERKNAVSYGGDLAVADVIKFMADHGNNSRHLISKKGILLTSTDKGVGHQDMFDGLSATTDRDDVLVKERFHEVLLKSKTPQRANRGSLIKSHASKGLHETAHHVVVGSVLIATDKLVNVHSFDNSKILIVKADQDTGFEGLIFNKPIRWEALQELEEGLEFLKQAPLYFGGPLIKQGMPLLGLTRRVSKSQYPEVLPSVYFLDQLATVNEIQELKHGNHSIADYWFFLGYSSWGWNQLFDEIAQGAWSIGDDNMAHFDWPSSLV
ncbi:hypothetical protein Ddye_030546 [Dipteronia dyeriana]|uniref:Thioredoxin domain-containing protein n=1 Tax=Dipteronia dyeriana TaxID=168575 RepID=A0AAD9TGI5_9ROSI|nr:hypothetical protein Ddye_030546 [Dipteronia dyeriana]